MTTKHVDIVFDGPPDHEAGRFVEVEQADGSGVKLGNWVQRDDGYWVLRITREDVERVLCDTAEPTEEDKEGAWGEYRDGPDYQPTDRHGVRAIFDIGWDAALRAVREARR